MTFTDPNFVLNILNPLLLLKIAFLILVVFQLLFGLVVLNQVRVMNKSVTQPACTLIISLASIISLLTISLFLTALAILSKTECRREI